MDPNETKDFTTISVLFNSRANVTDEDLLHEKLYTYKCEKSIAKNLTALDRVIITDPYNVLKIVTVVKINEESTIKKNSSINYKWITAIVKFI